MIKNPGHSSPFVLLLAAGVFTLASTLGPGLRIEPFYSWYYLFAWWPYIFAAESILAKRGNSLLFRDTSKFLRLLPLSLTVWLFFELYNFRLDNWHYLNVPSDTLARWTAYALSFATVLPGLDVTRRLLDELGAGRFSPGKKLTHIHKAAPWFMALGVVFMLLPLIWPRYFFPLVWGGVVFLIDPILYRMGGRSFMEQLQHGNWRNFFLWLYSGALCGILWELWNFWAGSKWFYTVPFVGELKLFEMPVLGFLGFPPFALECAVLINLFTWSRERIHLMPSARRRIVSTAIIVGALVFILAIFSGIDQQTVVTFRS